MRSYNKLNNKIWIRKYYLKEINRMMNVMNNVVTLWIWQVEMDQMWIRKKKNISVPNVLKNIILLWIVKMERTKVNNQMWKLILEILILKKHQENKIIVDVLINVLINVLLKVVAISGSRVTTYKVLKILVLNFQL